MYAVILIPRLTKLTGLIVGPFSVGAEVLRVLYGLPGDMKPITRTEVIDRIRDAVTNGKQFTIDKSNLEPEASLDQRKTCIITYRLSSDVDIRGATQQRAGQDDEIIDFGLVARDLFYGRGYIYEDFIGRPSVWRAVYDAIAKGSLTVTNELFDTDPTYGVPKIARISFKRPDGDWTVKQAGERETIKF